MKLNYLNLIESQLTTTLNQEEVPAMLHLLTL